MAARLAISHAWWRAEVCQQVFEEAAVDLGRALDAFSAGRKGERQGKPPRFPKFKRKATARQSFRLRNKGSGTATAIRVGDGEQARMVRFYPSTRRCAACCTVGEALSLSERIFRCSSCGHEADRDANAAACLAQYPRVVYSPEAPASGAWPHVAAKHAETQNVCGEESAGASSVWSVRETVLNEAERTSVRRPRRAVLYETVNTQ